MFSGSKLPQKLLVTSALPYANGNVHLGHLAGAYLPADICVRWFRLTGRDVLFICGSDEHGVPITLSAREKGITPKEVTDEYHEANGNAFKAANVVFDYWGRTSSEEHHELSKEIFLRLYEKGHIKKETTQQLYSEKSKMFLPDRYVKGQCPHCKNEDARGDQCDACGRTYEVTELVNPQTVLPGDDSTPVVKDTAHWFLKLEDFVEPLKEFVESHGEDSEQAWRPNSRREALGWLKRGLRARCITRDTEWGVEIPLKDIEAEGKRLYVWFDAPIGYVTFTKQYFAKKGAPDSWKEYWQSPECAILHYIGKDNIPFHTITWPAMQIGANENIPENQNPFNLPMQVVANDYLNFGKDKFSKSRGNVIRISDFAGKYGTDPMRWYLTMSAPEGNDSIFTWDEFLRRYNGELADVIGNFIHRTFTFAHKHFDGVVPDGDGSGGLEQELKSALDKLKETSAKELNRLRYKTAANAILEGARECNRYIDQKAPWKEVKTDKALGGITIRACLEGVAAIALALRPILPESAEKILSFFGAEETFKPGSADLDYKEIVIPGRKLNKAKILFQKLDEDDIPESE